MYDVTDANLIRDNSPQALPQRSLTTTAISKPDLAPSLASSVFCLDATLGPSCDGTAQTIYNTIAAPADSSAQSTYDFIPDFLLGS